MGQLPNDTVIMVSFRPSSTSTKPPSAAPHEARVAADAPGDVIIVNHSDLREVESFPAGNSITLSDPALPLADDTVVDAADDLVLLKHAAAPSGKASLYWVFLSPRNAPDPPYTVNPPDPQPGQSYAITSNDGGRITIVSTWPHSYVGSAGGPIPPFPA